MAELPSLKIITDAKMSIQELACVVGMSKVHVDEWIYRYNVIGAGRSAVRGKGRGGPRVYSFVDAMTLAASDVLVGNLRMRSSAAAEIIRRDRDLIVKHLLAGQELIGTTDAQDRSPGAVVTIRPLAIYERMRPALASLFPEETAELDRYLASAPPAPAALHGDLGAAVDRMERFSLGNATWTKTGLPPPKGGNEEVPETMEIETIIGSVMDGTGDKAEVSVKEATVFLWVGDGDAEGNLMLLLPSRARALAAILISAADMANGGSQ